MEGRGQAPQRAIPAVYMRGGTSRAIIFHARDLPPRDDAAWGRLFAAALGSPDPDGRQLDGLGGGISSLSKVAVVGPPSRADADVDYTFAQVAISRSTASFAGNCGNVSSAIGPFAVDEGLVATSGNSAVVRIHNTNTGKIIRADFPLAGGNSAVEGNLLISGVAQAGAPIRLAFLRPGGAKTGRLLPTGRVVDELEIGERLIRASLVDAANPVVIVSARDVGLVGDESPATIERDLVLMRLLEEIRIAAALAMGLASDRRAAEEELTNLPLVAMVSSTERHDAHLRVRMISAGQPHKAAPLTGAMAIAVAIKLEGTIAHRFAAATQPSSAMLIEHASGILPVDAVVRDAEALEVLVFRTARRLMEGRVLVPTSVWLEAARPAP